MARLWARRGTPLRSLTVVSEHPAVRTDLDAPARLDALALTMLLDSPPEEVFDRHTRLLTRILGAPVALLSFVDDERQFFKSAIGLDEPWASARGTGLSRSFCQHVVATDEVLQVTDARTDSRVSDNDAITDLGVVAYLGAPVHGPDGQPIGSLCVIDHRPRQWTAEDLSLLEELAIVTGEIISTRTAAGERRRAALELSHRLRSGLTGLQLEVADALAALAPDDAARPALLRVADGLAEQTAQLTEALQQLGRTEGSAETEVDVRALLEAVASAATTDDRPVSVEPGPPMSAAVSAATLGGAVREVVALLRAHGTGAVLLQLLPGESSWRVRMQAGGDGLPAQVARDLTARSDGGGLHRLSLAERVARQLGGRLLVAGGSPTTVDLVLPARVL